MTLTRVDGAEVTESGQNVIRPFFHEEFANRGVSRDFAERALHLFL